MKTNLEKQKQIFDKYSANINDSRYRKAFKIIKRFALSHPQEKLDILEIACCGGEFLELLKKQGHNVSGIEIAKQAAQRAKDKGINVKMHDVNKKLPYKDNSFDVIFSGELIEHTFDDLEFLRECKRILKPKGLIIITTPNLISLKNRILMLIGKNPRFAIADYHYHVYTLNLIKQLFQKAQLRKIKVMGNYIIYSKNREKILGSLFETLAEDLPGLAEHFIVLARK